MGIFGKLFGSNSATTTASTAVEPPPNEAEQKSPQPVSAPASATGNDAQHQPAPPAAESPQARAIVERWDAAIVDIQKRFASLLDESVTASQAIIPTIENDMTDLTRPWTAIEGKMHEYTEEISDTWDAISDELSDVDDLGDEVMDREGTKRDLAHCEVEILYQRAYRGVMAAAGEAMRQRALRADAGGHQCTQCGATLDEVTPVSQALNVACDYCTAVNTLDPGPALRIFAASGSMYLAQNAAQPAWESMVRAETRIRQYRKSGDVPMSLLEEYESSSRAHWTTRLGVEAEYVPEEEQYVATRLERYMKDADKLLRSHWQWRNRA